MSIRQKRTHHGRWLRSSPQAPGQRGGARRLIENGARPDLAGRAQPSTRRRAEAAGMIGADEGQIAGQNIVLSIGPPAEALALA